ncbi:MAG TPA: M42 family peptidase, partial [Anaerolineae bacterium]|nr:M42 family peptidase [Anaerolineae bacterium]
RSLLAGKSFDDRACVAAIEGCLELLAKRRHSWDVYAVATTQEEVGLRGATTSAYGVAPQLAIALDVTFGSQPGVSDSESMGMGDGPSIGLGANFHPKVHERLVATAKAHEIPYQIDPTPGRSMHTPVETIDTRDAERAARLLAEFIAELDGEFAQVLGVQVKRLSGQGGQAC